ncbi:hypothetical protein, partial [Kitasatospora sp. NPDC059327]|uniref:hypothetical protein n=1 Tax=Kitasatospora sp. NPDC059327 TaxID=3346803 RepID=UPI0036A3D362
MVTPGIALGMVQLLPWGWAAGLAVTGAWVVFYLDRLCAQGMLHQLRPSEFYTGSSSEPSDAARLRKKWSQSSAIPHERMMRKNGPKEHFIGAGRMIWPIRSIGIDVEPAPSRPEDGPAGPAPAMEPLGVRMPAQLRKHLAQQKQASPARFRPFEVEELHDFVAQRLLDPAPSHADDHPLADIEVLGLAALSFTRWAELDDWTWQQLEDLAVGKPNSGPGPFVARRYLWARIVSWHGQLGVSVLANFAYESGFLRVTVRPHIMTPLNKNLPTSTSPLSPWSAQWQRAAWLNAL